MYKHARSLIGVLTGLVALCSQAELRPGIDIENLINGSDVVLIGEIVTAKSSKASNGESALHLTLSAEKSIKGERGLLNGGVNIVVVPAPNQSASSFNGLYGIVMLKSIGGQMYAPVNPEQLLLPALRTSNLKGAENNTLAIVTRELSNTLTAPQASKLPAFSTVVASTNDLESTFSQVVEQLRSIPGSYKTPLLKQIVRGKFSALSKAWAVVGLLDANDVSELQSVLPAMVNVSDNNEVGTFTVNALAASLYNIRSLGQKDAVNLFNSIEQLLDSNDVKVRRAAASTLRANLNKNSIPLLIKATKDDDREVRYFGAFGLSLLTELKPAYAMAEYFEHEPELLRFWSDWANNNTQTSVKISN